MITKDVKRLLEKLNEHTTRALETAAGFSISRTHYEVGIEHLLAKLMEDGAGDITQIFNHFDVKTGKLWEALLKQLDQFKDGNTGRPSFSPILLQLVESAWITASVHHGYSEIRSGALLEALIESESLHSMPYFDFFAPINRDELRQNFVDIVGSSSENTPLARRMKPSADGAPREGETALDIYMTDLTGAAANGEIDPVNGRDQEIRQIIDILSRRRKNNPILVGEAGVGKTAVALPIFAFANAGVSFHGMSVEKLTNGVSMGIIFGLFFGKQIGVFGMILLAHLLRIAKLPPGATPERTRRA